MKSKAKIKIKKSTLTTLITIAGIVLAYIIMTLLSGAGVLSNQMKGLLVPICAYAMLAVSLNLVVGILGELSLGHAGFLYVGAYTGTIFTVAMSNVITNDILRFILGMIVGGVFAALFGLLIGSAVLKLQGDYLAIVTLAFGEIIRSVLGNVMYISKDASGLHFDFNDGSTLNSSDIIAKGAQGITVHRMSTFLIGIILLIITVLVVMNLTDSRAGRAIKAVRDNKIATETVGISVSKFRLLAFTVSSAIAGVAGVYYAHNYATLTGTKFDFNFSINILVMVVLGGMGSIPGSIIAAIVLTILPEKIRFLGDYRMVIYAVILIVMMIFSWNPKCIELRKTVSAKIKGIFKSLKSNEANKGMAIASLVTGALAIPFGFFTGFMGIILGAVAILLGVFSKGKTSKRKGIAIGGIIVGAIGITTGIVMIFLVIFLMEELNFIEFYKDLFGFYKEVQ